MLNARRNETADQLKERMMESQGEHLHIHLDGVTTRDAAPYPPRYPRRPNESTKSNFKHPGSGTGDAQTSVSVGTLPAPDDPNSHYELETNEDGSTEIMLVSDVSEGEQPMNQNMTSDRLHKLHTSNDPMLRKMNKANRDFWKRGK